jgi:hypothetical protein
MRAQDNTEGVARLVVVRSLFARCWLVLVVSIYIAVRSAELYVADIHLVLREITHAPQMATSFVAIHSKCIFR